MIIFWTKRVPFLGKKWHTGPSYCSHWRRDLPSLPQPRWLAPDSPNLQIALSPDMTYLRLKVGLLSWSQAGNGSLSPWREALGDSDSALCGWLAGASQTQGIRHVDLNVTHNITHIVLILEHSSLCIHSFRPLISPAVKEKYFSVRE